jgi:LCP family protein required for cell wall assembly
MSDLLGKKWKWTLFSVSLILIAAIAYYIIPIIQFGMAIDKEPNESKYFKQFHEDNEQDKDEFVPPEWEGTERVNILLLGGDSRGLAQNEVPRSDSMMVVSLDPTTSKAYLFSILRDTYASIPDHYSTRINAALALGGPRLAMETVSNFLDMPVQYYMYADFEGFVALVDAIGGIEYEVEKDMYYTSRADGPEFDINLKKGLQHLDGKMALQYVRFRYDALGDYARTERQRKFMQALADKMKSTSSLIRLPNTLKKVTPYIETNISLNNMLKLGTLAYEAKAEGITSEQIPPAHLLREETIEGSAVITVDHEELVNFLEEVWDERELRP